MFRFAESVNTYTDKDWEDVLAIANEQAITGAMVTAIEAIEEKLVLP